MGFLKQAKDQVARLLLGSTSVPSGLAELNRYFYLHGPIDFKFEKQEDGSYVALSDNFLYGSIITHAERLDQLDAKIKDAILTAFEVPSSYQKEAGVHRLMEGKYAPA